MSPTEEEHMEERKEEVTKTQSIPCTLQTSVVLSQQHPSTWPSKVPVQKKQKVHIVKVAKH